MLYLSVGGGRECCLCEIMAGGWLWKGSAKRLITCVVYSCHCSSRVTGGEVIIAGETNLQLVSCKSLCPFCPLQIVYWR